MRSDYEILRENIRQFRVQKLNKYFHLVCYILGSFRINLSLKKGLRKPGIEPGAQRWQRWILPLNHLRLFLGSVRVLIRSQQLQP